MYLLSLHTHLLQQIADGGAYQNLAIHSIYSRALIDLISQIYVFKYLSQHLDKCFLCSIRLTLERTACEIDDSLNV